MTALAGLLWATGLVVLSLSGCSEVTGEAATATLSLVGTDAEWVSYPLEGAKLCQADTGNCASSDASGHVSIRLPVGQQTSLILTRKGYGSYLIPVFFESPVENRIDHSMATVGHLADQFWRIDSPYPMRNTGTILLWLVPPFAGATYQLVDATGKPFYHAEDERRSLDLTATTSIGGGGFAEVTAGEFQIKLGGTAQRCVPANAWPGDVNSVRFPVRENFITSLSAICPPPQ